MMVNSAFFRINQKQQIFHRDLPVFPLTLTETLAECPLIQLSFSYSFFFRAEIHKLEKFQKLAICKHKYSQVFKNLPFANISTRKIRFFLAQENKFTQKSVRLS